MTVINIVGAGHCGSTILDVLLNTHPQIFGVGELALEPLKGEQKCSCGQTLNNCNVWSRVKYNRDEKFVVFCKSLDFFLMRKKFYSEKRLLSENEVSHKMKNLEGLYQELLDVTGKSIICDSTKNPYYVFAQYNYIKNDNIIIHIIRDPRANIWSYYKKYQKVWRYVYLWIVENMKAFSLLMLCKKSNYILVDYKELCDNSDIVFRRIAKALSVDDEFSIKNISKINRHQVRGNRLIKEENLTLKQDKKWQNEMPRLLRFSLSPLMIAYFFFKYGGNLLSYIQGRER